MNQRTAESSPEVVVDLTEKKPIRVLHVDDELALLKVAKQCLELQGLFQVDTASSVEEALNKLKEKEYDAVVSDYQMSGKNGLEFLEMLRKDGNTIPFVIFTGKGREEVAVKAWSLGADHYVDKTGDPETVYCEMAHCLRSIVEKHFAEAQMKETANKLQTICQNALEGITYVDAEENIVYANKAFADIVGYEQKQLAGMNVRRIVDDENWAKIESETKRRWQGESNRYEVEFRRSDGTVRNAQVSGAPLLDHDGWLAGTVGIILDITERKKTEESLRQSEEKYRNLFEGAMDAIVTLDLKGSITAANSSVLCLGYKKEDLVGKNILDFVSKEYWPAVMRDFSKVAQGEPVKNEVELVVPAGKILVEYHAGAIVKESNIAGVHVNMRDMTERQKAEETLRKSEAKYRSLIEQSMQGIVIAQGVIPHLVFANSTMSKILGYTVEELTSLSPQQTAGLVHPDDRELFFGRFKDRLEGKQVQPQYEVRGVRKDGTMVWLELSSARVEYGGQPAVQAIFTDITERKKSEETLEESEERFRGLFESIQDPVGIFVAREGRLIDYNAAFKKSSGYTDEELKGKVFLDFVHPDDRAMVLEKYQTKYSEEELPLIYEIRGVNKRGESIPLELSVSAYKKKDRVIGIEVIHRDITERKRYEERLSALNIYSRDLNMAEKREEIYRLTLDAMQKVLGFEYADFFMIDKSMLYIVDQRGYPEPFPLELPLDGSKKGITIKVAKTGNSVIVQDVRKNTDFVEGLPGILSELAVPIKAGQKTLGILNVEDKRLNAFDEKDQELLEILASHAATAISNLEYATNLETYAREIRESQQRFERLFMDNPEAAVYLGPDSHILDINPCFEKLFEYNLAEIKGKHINEVVVPKDKLEEAEMLDRKAVEGYVYHDTVRRRKDGSLVPVSISAAPIMVEGRPAGSLGMYKNISELKNAERKLEMTNEKLRVVGGLTRHDVRNKLSVITGNVYLNKKRLAGHPETLESFEEMESACEQIVRIFDFAKDYELLGVEELKYVDVGKIVNEAVSLFPNLQGIEITNTCDELTVLADSLLRQLFYNLIDNSLKHGEKLSQIRIHYEKAEENQLKLVYEDDGVGVSKGAKARLFTEGFTMGKGLGYGLYLIKRMMEVYGWTIEENGKPGKGARFVMTIPRMNTKGRENYKIA